MKKFVIIILYSIFSLLLSSCNTYYFAYNGEVGYSDLSLGGEKVEVTYIAPEKFNVTQAKQCAIFRAIELADAKGNPFIKIIDTKERFRKRHNATEAKKSVTERIDSLGHKQIEYKETPTYVTSVSQVEVTMVFEFLTENNGDAISVADVKNQLDKYLGR